MLSLGLGLQAVRGGASAPSYDPAALFASSEEGVWYDIHPDYCFTDTGRTTNAGDGDAVAGITDRSGNGNHASQGTLANRPILRQSGALWYLDFDPSVTPRWLETSAIDFTGTDAMTVCAAIQKPTDDITRYLCELSAAVGSNAGSFYIRAPLTTSSNQYRYRQEGASAQLGTATTTTGYTAPRTDVLTGLGDISADLTQLRVNGTLDGSDAADLGAGNFGNHALYLGARTLGQNPYAGRIYSFIARGALTAGDDLTGVEAYAAAKAGI